MMLLFAISVSLLMLSLLLSVFTKRYTRVINSAILFFSSTTLLISILIFIARVYRNQFTFLQPGYLVLLILPIILFVMRVNWPHYFSKAINYPLTEKIGHYKTFSALLANWGQAIATLMAVVLFIIALARPVTVNQTQLPPTQGIDIMMIIDASASMRKNDFYPNRFQAAQKNAIRFVGKRFNDRIGLTVFAKNATLASPLTLDHEALQDLIASLYLGIVDPNLTAIGDALGVASNHLKNSSAKSKIILLLTDGSNNAGALDPLLAAKAAASYGIKIYTIATASPPGESLFSSAEDEIDEGLLMNIANETGGAFYRAKNENELQDIYDKINELEKTDFTQTARISHYDIYPSFLWAGLLLLLAGCVIGKLLFIRIP